MLIDQPSSIEIDAAKDLSSEAGLQDYYDINRYYTTNNSYIMQNVLRTQYSWTTDIIHANSEQSEKLEKILNQAKQSKTQRLHGTRHKDDGAGSNCYRCRKTIAS